MYWRCTILGVGAALLLLATMALATQVGAQVDGVIDEGEYPHGFTDAAGDLEIDWLVDNGTVQFGLRAHTTGWVAIGLEPTQMMKDADMYFGWYSEGAAHAEDAYATGTFGPHPRDTDQGGTFDMTEYDVGEEGGWTTFEFQRDLDTGDGRDHRVPASDELDIIWAYGADDDWTVHHVNRGYATIHTGTGQVDEGRTVPRWLFHASLMTTAVLLALWGYTIVRSKGRGWAERHRKVQTVAATVASVGLVFGIAMVASGSGIHLRVPHAWFGVVTLAMVLTTVTLGYLWRRADAQGKARIRPVKLWMGRTTLVLLLLTLSFGILTVVLKL